MIHFYQLKKIIFIFLILFNLSSVIPAFAADEASPSPGTTEKLATSPSECGSGNGENGVSPRNCLFLEEPIGGKPGYDLYTVKCVKGVCTTSLWRGGPIKEGERGPIQAILTSDADKPYQGPFGLLYGYLTLVYNYMSGLIVGVSVLFVVIGGIQMTTSGGDETKFTEGKGRITKAIVGIILWFTASLILYTINPTFFSF